MTKEEYFTGSDVSNYYITTAYLQDAPEMILRDLADRIQEEFRRRGDQITTNKLDTCPNGCATCKYRPNTPYEYPCCICQRGNGTTDQWAPAEESKGEITKKDTGKELTYVGRLETQDEYLLDILKEQGFYLVYNKKETKFGELGYYQVLYPKED